MHEIDVNTARNKEEQYLSLLPQLHSLCSGEPDLTANLANIAAALKQTFQWWWIGFYLVKQHELVLGPFQGPVACTRIGMGKGVCGTAWEQKTTIIVDDVELFPGHIACSNASRSEIVVPVIKDGHVLAVIDADSEHIGHFDHIDQQYLEQLAAFTASLF